MADCKPFSSPMALKPASSSPNDNLPCSNPSLYRSIVGGLQYLTITRPDLAFAVNFACQFMHQPFVQYFVMVKRLLRYLKGTFGYGLQFSLGPLTLHAFSDSDWARNSLDRHSTTGFCVFLGPNLVSWSAKKQPTVARSSTEAEYRALAHTAAELSWLGMLLSNLHVPSISPTLWCDNVSAISLSSNPVFHARTKHIEVDYHYVRERVAAKQLTICHISTSDHVVDIFTNPLSISCFAYLQSKLMVLPSPISLGGHDNVSAKATEAQPISAAELQLKPQSSATVEATFAYNSTATSHQTS
ncbi:uncharacterized protein LOC114316440 [Camellia sinensis]|uniref:uncharacterized protein LOC114316440 n=1 Tax=Camellia sinensis TaxID=4442 RepID=UPI001036BFD9|nr:uncharacterized protein LOC114316440 [Camellia sinensis]